MANHRAAAALLIASLLVAIAVADARHTVHGGAQAPATPISIDLVCTKVHGVQPGETCFAAAQAAKLTLEQFLEFNPNINCRKLFVGQWICLSAAE
ncbi:hypothetical protein ACP4OV_024936 [Aristida adscensionis]